MLAAVDSALVVLCAASGVEVETEKVWQYAAENGLPRIAFINKMDRENADYFKVVTEMKEKFGNNVISLQIPIGAEESFQGIVDILAMKAFTLAGNQMKEVSVPGELQSAVDEARNNLIEAAAEGDDELLTKYLEGKELSEEEIINGLYGGISQGKVFPVFCGSAVKNIGVSQLLDSMLKYSPSPENKVMTGLNPQNKQPQDRSINDPFSALVFKTTADPFVGRLSFLKVVSGVLKPDNIVYNANKEKAERISNVFTMRGKHQDMMTAGAWAGDIAVLAKLQDTATGDTLCDKDRPIVYEQIVFPKPMFTMAVDPKNKGDEDKLGGALHRLTDEDPTLRVNKDIETGQLLVSGLGELHLDIMGERMKRKFGVEVKLSEPRVPFRETIRGYVKVEGKHKKQSGGRGQYGHVWLQLDPLPSGGQFEFVDKIFGGAVPNQYIPAVEKGVRETMAKGIIAGYPMVDVKVTLYDGSYHTVDSSEMAFKIASAMALKKGVLQAKPAILEPICDVVVNVPESYMGDVISDLNTKRGCTQGMEPVGKNWMQVKAQVPMAEMFRYSIDLRSITQGRGNFNMTFSHYEEVPQKLAENIIASAKKEKDEEE